MNIKLHNEVARKGKRINDLKSRLRNKSKRTEKLISQKKRLKMELKGLNNKVKEAKSQKEKYKKYKNGVGEFKDELRHIVKQYRNKGMKKHQLKSILDNYNYGENRKEPQTGFVGDIINAYEKWYTMLDKMAVTKMKFDTRHALFNNVFNPGTNNSLFPPFYSLIDGKNNNNFMESLINIDMLNMLGVRID